MIYDISKELEQEFGPKGSASRKAAYSTMPDRFSTTICTLRSSHLSPQIITPQKVPSSMPSSAILARLMPSKRSSSRKAWPSSVQVGCGSPLTRTVSSLSPKRRMQITPSPKVSSRYWRWMSGSMRITSTTAIVVQPICRPCGRSSTGTRSIAVIRFDVRDWFVFVGLHQLTPAKSAFLVTKCTFIALFSAYACICGIFFVSLSLGMLCAYMCMPPYIHIRVKIMAKRKINSELFGNF